MSEIQKGNYVMKIIDSTGQFSITGNGYVGGGSIQNSDSSNNQRDAKDLVDLLRAYLLAQKWNKS